MSLPMLARSRAPRAAFGQIVLNEARLAWRQPAGIIVSIGISLGLLVLFGEVPVFTQSSANLRGSASSGGSRGLQDRGLARRTNSVSSGRMTAGTSDSATSTTCRPDGRWMVRRYRG